MVKTDKDAWMCDLAETYHIYDYESLPLSKVAIFSVGLRANSRIKMKMQGMKCPADLLLSAAMVDRLSLLLWAKTKDGAKGINKPKSIVSAFMQVEEERDVVGYATPDEFDKAWKKIMQKGEV